MARYAISDIHGCFYTLRELLDVVGFNKEDQLFFSGDFINRGGNSKQVIDFLMQLEKGDYQVKFSKGNHEDMLFDSSKVKDFSGGDDSLHASFGISHFTELEEEYKQWIKNLEYFHTSEEYILVHAGLDFHEDDILKKNENMLWINDWYGDIDYDRLGDRIIVHGHNILPKQLILAMRDNLDKDRVLDIDNGCYKAGEKNEGNLCCFNLDSRELHFQENID
ncbi:serine/threonine protein phosphatase 1 [Marivirga sericea]|uniref:Serine/threonine protein phosphatase 1 n=1 Tax=Marivirga sericea TaxID=1028 RepID=A0A1X7JME7_9BACT|nr:metallophosphoesterase [Marivirga sericea]SMG29396.1 serine/threonine protein phosphatase 1 [Marivirga sericea]